MMLVHLQKVKQIPLSRDGVQQLIQLCVNLLRITAVDPRPKLACCLTRLFLKSVMSLLIIDVDF